MANGEVRAQDYPAFKQLERQGRVRLHDVGISLDPDALWFNLSPAGRPTPGRTLLANKSFRQAISYGVDRQLLADTVYLGAAVPVFGPITPGNRRWYVEGTPPPVHDPARARARCSIDWISRIAMATACAKPPIQHAGPLFDADPGRPRARPHRRSAAGAAEGARNRRRPGLARYRRDHPVASARATTTASISARRPAAPTRR